jgi:hypothetical protein
MPLRHPFWLLALVDRIMLQSRAIEYATVTARPALQQSGGKAAEVGRLARTFCCRRQTDRGGKGFMAGARDPEVAARQTLETGRPDVVHSSLMPANLTTFPHFSAS